MAGHGVAVVVFGLWLSFSGALPAAATPSGELDLCRRLFAEAPGTRAPAKCFYTRAKQSDLDDLVIEELSSLHREHPEDPWLQYYLATTLRLQPDPRAEPLLRQAADRFAALGEHHGEFFARQALRSLLANRGRLEEAAEQIRILRDSLGGVDDPEIQGRLRLAEADQLFDSRRDLGRAYRQAQEGVALLSSAHDELLATRSSMDQESWEAAVANVRRPRRDGLLLLGNIALELGRPRESLHHYEQLARQAEEAGDPYTAVAARGNAPLALTALYEREPSEDLRQESLRRTREALGLAQAIGHRRAEAKIHLGLAKLLGLPEGARHFESCIAHAKKSPKPDAWLSQCMAPYALALAEESPAAALEARRKALEAARRSEDPRVLAHVLEVGSQVSWEVLPPSEAIRDSLEALDAIEALRELQTGAPGRTRLFSEWAIVYQRLFGRLVRTYRKRGERHYLELAFRVSERMRSRALQEALDLATLPLEPPPALATRRGEILAEMRRLQHRLLRDELTADERAELAEDLRQLERDFDEVQEEIHELQLATTRLEAPRFAALAEVQGALGDREALLLYQLAPRKDIYGYFAGSSWVVAISKDRLFVHPLEDADALAWRLPALLGLIEGQRDVEPATVTRLYEDLTGPLLEELPPEVDTLILLPDGMLHSLPFSVLQTREQRQPLGLRYRLVRAPSATLWHRWRDQPSRPGGRPALALADPELPGTTPTPGNALAATTQRTSAKRLPPLPLAREEGRALVRHLGRGVLLKHGGKATERLVKNLLLQDFHLVHFAAHAEADPDDPESSAIYLTPDEDNVDGLLQFREIVDLELDGRIVVLSACDTATGEILRGEGVLDLARAFFQAGAHAVVASLWPLRDDDGRDFFEAFYRHLAEGESLAGALQGAQIDRIDAGAPAAAWAGLVVLGDGSMVPFPDAKARLPFVAVALLALGIFSLAVVVATLAVRRRAE